MQRKTHTIDAAGKILGRLASEIAQILRGKHKTDFVPNKDAGDFVMVENIEKIKLSGKKLEQKEYIHHTGYLGNLKRNPLKKIFEKDAKNILQRAVMGMLPKNKLRAKMIKRLKFK